MRVIKKLSNLLLKTLYLNGVFLTKNNFIIVLVTCLTFSVNFLFGQTNVSGVISANTTWTKLGSPYKLTGNIGITSSATLTIEPGVEVFRENDYTIIINGTINAIGNTNNNIKFTSSYASAVNFFLDFQKTNLANSQLSYILFNNTIDQRQNFLRIGNEAEHAEQTPKNSGDLVISNSKFTNTYLLTKGYSTSSRLLINYSELINVYIMGGYPRTEPIILSNSLINNSTINSDSYNYGITLNECISKNSNFLMGCCGANFTIQRTSFLDCQFGGRGDYGQMDITKSILINTPINYPSSTVNITSSIILSNKNNLTTSRDFGGSASIDALVSMGGGSITKLNISSKDYYAVRFNSGNSTILNSSFSKSRDAIYFSNFGSISFTNTNINNNGNYFLYNNSTKPLTLNNTYFDGQSSSSIDSKTFDYNDDFNKGLITLNNNVQQKNLNSPITPVSNVAKYLANDRIILTWSANTESDIAGYKVYYGGYTGYSYTTSVDVGNVLTYTLPAGVGINDDIAVTAYDTSKDGTDDQFDGNESWYSPANKTPEAPADLKTDIAAKKIKLSWTASTSTGVNAYYVYRSTNGTTYAKVGSAVSSNFIDRGLTAQTKYYYKISAIDSLDLSYDNYGLESQFSDVVSASPNNIIYVAKNGNDANIGSKTSPKLKISAASTDAVSGDSILINDGTYTENISYRDKQLSFIGINGATKVILKPLLSSQIMAITQNGDKSLFKGLTFADGGNSAGSAIYTQTSNPIIENCIFRNHSQGSILQLNRNNFTITNCLVYNNNANVFLDLANGLDSIPYINNITYTNNTNNWFYATGITTFAPNVKNSIIWNSSAIKYQGGLSIENSIVKGGFPGTTSNIDTSPRFLDSLNNDFRLANYSPAIGLGRSISGITTDILDLPRPGPSASNPDAGAYENIYSQPSPYVVADSSNNGMISFKFKLAGLNNLKKINVYKGLSSAPSTKYQSINPNIEFTDILNQEFNKPLHYRFTSVDLSDRESGFSNEIKTIAFTSPKLKAPLNLSLKIDTTISFSWSKIDSASLYTLQFSKDSTFSTDLTEKIVPDTFLVQSNLTHNSNSSFIL